jgi:hypothetical protein
VADAFGPRIAYAGAGVVIAGVAILFWRSYQEPVSDG